MRCIFPDWIKACLILWIVTVTSFAQTVQEIDLNGFWQVEDRFVQVPGLAADPREYTKGEIKYQRIVYLPEGDWTHAILVPKGARFCPSVYVNGELVSKQPGGMTVTKHHLKSDTFNLGGSVDLGIFLESLDVIDGRDASRISSPDHWQSNISSCLWEDVVLRLHGSARIDRVIPVSHRTKDKVDIQWQIENLDSLAGAMELQFKILDQNHNVVAHTRESIPLSSQAMLTGQTTLDFEGNCKV